MLQDTTRDYDIDHRVLIQDHRKGLNITPLERDIITNHNFNQSIELSINQSRKLQHVNRSKCMKRKNKTKSNH